MPLAITWSTAFHKPDFLWCKQKTAGRRLVFFFSPALCDEFFKDSFIHFFLQSLQTPSDGDNKQHQWPETKNYECSFYSISYFLLKILEVIFLCSAMCLYLLTRRRFTFEVKSPSGPECWQSSTVSVAGILLTCCLKAQSLEPKWQVAYSFDDLVTLMIGQYLQAFSKAFHKG